MKIPLPYEYKEREEMGFSFSEEQDRSGKEVRDFLKVELAASKFSVH